MTSLISAASVAASGSMKILERTLEIIFMVKRPFEISYSIIIRLDSEKPKCNAKLFAMLPLA